MRCLDTCITITDSVETFGSFNAGEIKSILNAFGFSVSGSVPDQHNCNFTIIASDGVNNWESYFTVKAQAPVIEFTNFTIADPSGNNNGKLDPGETATLTIGLKIPGTLKHLV